MSSSYTHLFGLKQTGLRFFTVYGPWGRPDMAYFGFAEAIMAGEPVTLYEEGRLKRDFTYIDDIVAGILGVFDHPPGTSAAPVFNIGNNQANMDRAGAAPSWGAERTQSPKPEADPVRPARSGAARRLCADDPVGGGFARMWRW